MKFRQRLSLRSIYAQNPTGLMVQASARRLLYNVSVGAGQHLRARLYAFASVPCTCKAGTGKSFLLTTVYLWCLLKRKKVKAAAPTGIAAANVEVEGTDVAATTIHALFERDS